LGGVFSNFSCGFVHLSKYRSRGRSTR
jgi:hypothetical protein